MTLTLALVATGCLAVRAAAAQGDYLPAPDSGFLVGTYTLQTSPDSFAVYPSFKSTQILLPAGWAVRVSVDGTHRVTPNAGCRDGPERTLGPAGLRTTGHPYAVAVGVGTETSPPTATLDLQPHLANTDTVTTFAIGPGVLWAARRVPASACPASGAQTITATVLPPPTIVFDRPRAVRGDTVSARILVSWSKRLAVKRAWIWEDSGAVSSSAKFVSGCRAGDRTCRLIVRHSGSLRIPEALIAGNIPQVANSSVLSVGPAWLRLTARPDTVASGSQAVFIAHRSDGQPVRVHDWAWKEQPGAAQLGPLAVGCVGGDSLCVTFVENTSPVTAKALQTGTMTAWMLVDGWKDSATVALTVLPKTREIPPEQRATMTITVAPNRPAADTVRLFMEALVDEKPVLLSAPQLTYPEPLKSAGIEGRVLVQAIIDTLGHAEAGTVKVLLSPNPGFDEAAKSYVLGTAFRPARVSGRVVRVLVQLPVIFKSSGP